jgi:hypothetical protein
MALTPYAEVASTYVMAGWDILPLPAMSKKKPPTGYTGENALEIDEEIALGDWMDIGHNVGFRLPKTLIGIDIDSYKDEGRTFKRLIAKLGALPETFGITSQDDVKDGATLFFSIPLGVRLRGSVGSVDLIQSHHRYSVAPRSIHPSGRVYRWVSSSGLELPWTPEPDQAPNLPVAWLEYLMEKEAKEVPVLTQQEEIEFSFEAGMACRKMNALLKGAIIRLKEKKASRHDLMVLSTWAMTGEAAKGHLGYDRILAAYQKAWEKQFSSSERSGRPLSLEFTSAVRGAQRKIHKGMAHCSCNEEARESPQTSASLKMWR